MSLFAKAKKARENKKGFTLVELIVVLVILAILAAIMVPSMTKWIDKAKIAQVKTDARSVYIAAQSLASEEYAKAKPKQTNITSAAIRTLAELGSKGTITFTPTTDINSQFKVTKIGYSDGTYYVQYSGNVCTVYKGTSAVAANKIE